MFRLYDFWDEEHYREDSLWNAHNVYRLFMIRYQENYKYLFINLLVKRNSDLQNLVLFS